MGSPVRALLLTALTACLATPTAAQPSAAATRPSTAAPAATKDAAPPAKAGSRSGSRAFVPGRLLVGFAARAGEGGRQAAAAAVDGRVLAGHGRTRVLALDQGADVVIAGRSSDSGIFAAPAIRAGFPEAAAAIGDLAAGEDAIEETRAPTLDRGLDAPDFDDVDAHRYHAPGGP